MNRFVLSQRSRNNLTQVHPDLVAVTILALYSFTCVDFAIIEGKRGIERQKQLVAESVSWTMNSKHLIQSDGFAHAVDCAPWVNGTIPWDEWKYFRQIAEAMFKAADFLKVDIEWGGNWPRIKDGPHFQLET